MIGYSDYFAICFATPKFKLLQFNYLYSASQLTLIWKAETIKDSDFGALGILQYVMTLSNRCLFKHNASGLGHQLLNLLAKWLVDYCQGRALMLAFSVNCLIFSPLLGNLGSTCSGQLSDQANILWNSLVPLVLNLYFLHYYHSYNAKFLSNCLQVDTIIKVWNCSRSC